MKISKIAKKKLKTVYYDEMIKQQKLEEALELVKYWRKLICPHCGGNCLHLSGKFNDGGKNIGMVQCEDCKKIGDSLVEDIIL